MTFDFPRRVLGLQAEMHEVGVDVTILSVGADLPYFIGHEATPSERLTVLVVPRSGDPTLVVPQLEAPGIPEGQFDVCAWNELDDPVQLAADMVTRPNRVAVGDHMWSVFLTRFQKVWPNIEWKPASELTSRLRLIKDRDEIHLLRQAASAVDRVMERIPSDVRFGGRSEIAVARDLAELTVEEGHDRAEFTIVASGPNAASPHHHPGTRVLVEGDVVVCDFGGRLGGYFSDSTRTFAVGPPSARAGEAHALVSAANQIGRETARPGLSCQEVDRVVREVIVEAGYGRFFIHRTGHGIGLEVHEHPYIVEGNETTLSSGMAFSIEPGVYIPDELGVRIEDIVVCGEDGVESLNQSNRGLVTVA